MKPLFIPLKREYFEAFANGTKDTEYRPYGKRWNEWTCAVGREVVLSCGYGKARRLRGKVTAFEARQDVTHTQTWLSIYGQKHWEAACIRIALQPNEGRS